MMRYTALFTTAFVVFLMFGVILVRFIIRALKRGKELPPEPGGPEDVGAMQTLKIPGSFKPAPNTPETLDPSVTHCFVLITDAGPNKIRAIAAIRACRTGIDLRALKAFVDNVPQTLFRDLPVEQALEIKYYLQAAGVSASLGRY